MKPDVAAALDLLVEAIASRVVEKLGAQAVATAPIGPALMTIASFAAHVGCSIRHVHELVRRGLPCIGAGRARRVDVARALAWMRDEPSARKRAELAAANDADPVAADAAARAKRRRKAVQ